MKTIKTPSKLLISLLLSLLIVVSVNVNAETCPPVERDWSHLQFNENGKFEIMIVADIQIGNHGLDHATRRFLYAALSHPSNANIDLIVLLGDNLASDPALRDGGYVAAIRSYMDIFWHFQIPVAVVFGNHEWNASGPGDLMPQVRVFQEFPNTIMMVQDPEYTEYRDGNEFFIAELDRDGRNTPSIGNYNLLISSSCGTNPLAYNLWFFYTGSSPAELGGFDGVRDATLNWYDWKSKRLQARNGGNVVPSIVLQHVPVHREVSLDEDNFIDNTPPNEFNFRPSRSFAVSELRYRNQYARHQARGDVEAIFFGHEHSNHFWYFPEPSACGLPGIPLIFTGRSALCRRHTSIGPFAVVRVITIKEELINQEGVSFTTRTYAADARYPVPADAWGNLQPKMDVLADFERLFHGIE